MISCIVLAAGESRRFGSPKPLAKIGGQTALGLVCQNLTGSRLDEIIVVLGADAPLVRPRVPQDARLKIVVNALYREGQTSSLKAGLSAVSVASSGFMVLPVDTPFVKTETIDLLASTFLEDKHLILLPVYAGKKGHPPVFSADLKTEFQGLDNDEPLSVVQQRHADKVFAMSVDDTGVTLSFNTPEELNKISASWLLAQQRAHRLNRF